MKFCLVYKVGNDYFKEEYDFNTNPVFYQKFDITGEPNLIEDDMILEEEAEESILKRTQSKEILFYSDIQTEITYYHSFKDFFNLIY